MHVIPGELSGALRDDDDRKCLDPRTTHGTLKLLSILPHAEPRTVLTLSDNSDRLRGGLSRRDVFTVGALGVSGLTMADVLRARAAGGETTSQKSIIMVYLPGGPSHIDTFDMKPEAPSEIRGEFKPIQSKVPGLDLCELLPLHAKIATSSAWSTASRALIHTAPNC